MSAPAPPLPADLIAGLKRLKLASMRRLAPELLVVAKTQRWSPEDFLRTIVEAEITARDESNARHRQEPPARRPRPRRSRSRTPGALLHRGGAARHALSGPG